MKPLSPKQLEVCAHVVNDKTVCIATGAVRSGKTTGQHMGFALWSARHGVGFEHALIGKNVESAIRNVGNSLMSDYADMGIPARLDKSFGTRIIFRHGGRDNSIWILGAVDKKARQRIQGATLKGLMIDECTNVPEEMWQMSYSRLSVPGSKLFGTTNPEGPAHWFKRKVIDKLASYNGYQVHFKP